MAPKKRKPNADQSKSKAEKKRELNLLLVQKINANKSVIFGSFSATITRELKEQTWESIFDYAKSIGFEFPADKDWSHLRDVTWPNWRKRAVEKWDKKRQTGEGGGEETKMTEFDEAVMDVIGRESAAIVGIGDVRESLEMAAEEAAAAVSALAPPAAFVEVEDQATPVSSTLRRESNESIPPKKRKKDTGEKVSPVPSDDGASALQKAKLEKTELQVEHLKLANYKIKLEIFEMENRLGFQHKYPVDTPRLFSSTFGTSRGGMSSGMGLNFALGGDSANNSFG